MAPDPLNMDKISTFLSFEESTKIELVHVVWQISPGYISLGKCNQDFFHQVNLETNQLRLVQATHQLVASKHRLATNQLVASYSMLHLPTMLYYAFYWS